MISSTANTKVKRLVALRQKARLRREEGVFLVEGEKMFLEAPQEWLQEVYVSETFFAKCGRVQGALEKSQFELVSDEVFLKISDTQTPQGILCVLAIPQYSFKECMTAWLSDKKAPFLMLLEDLQDPGNLGTILRAGEGAGVSGIVMTAKTVDIFNPKVIRSTMGSIYRVPFFTAEELAPVIELLKNKGIAVYAAHLDERNVCYDEPDYTQPSAFLIGNESRGLKRETADRADCYIKIPMAGQVESLNAAVAGAILMYEAARQRRNGGLL